MGAQCGGAVAGAAILQVLLPDGVQSFPILCLNLQERGRVTWNLISVV